MAKRKNIGGVVYYPTKKHKEGYCCICNRTINSQAQAYYIEKTQSTDMVCAICVNRMFTENQRIKNKEIAPYPSDTPLFVGKKHNCGKQTYESVPFYFFNEQKKKKLIVKKCPNCGLYFVDTDMYYQNTFYFDKYLLLNSNTQKPIAKFTIISERISTRKYSKSYEQIPNSVRWAIKHPFQGGDCSGK